MEDKGSNAANEDLGNSANRTVDDVTVSAHEKVDQMSDAVQPVVDRMALNAHAAIDTVAGAAVAAVDTLGVKGEQLTNVQAKVMDTARAYAREQPIAALGIAVAAGWILSRLMR
jgi:ElaB/YqjD/DUF883 family membrane-anchored ribosome-binding protein